MKLIQNIVVALVVLFSLLFTCSLGQAQDHRAKTPRPANGSLKVETKGQTEVIKHTDAKGHVVTLQCFTNKDTKTTFCFQ